MSEAISSELLSEVLNKHPLSKIIDIKQINNNICWIESDIHKSIYDKTGHINIYELMHLMKEWLLSHVEDLGTGSNKDLSWCIFNSDLGNR